MKTIKKDLLIKVIIVVLVIIVGFLISNQVTGFLTSTGAATSSAISSLNTNSSHETIALCEKINIDGCYIRCIDVIFYYNNGALNRTENTGSSSCHDQGWTDPRTGKFWE